MKGETRDARHREMKKMKREEIVLTLLEDET